MSEFIGGMLLSTVIQLAIARFYPVFINDLKWWYTSLPLTIIISMLIKFLINS